MKPIYLKYITKKDSKGIERFIKFKRIKNPSKNRWHFKTVEEAVNYFNEHLSEDKKLNLEEIDQNVLIRMTEGEWGFYQEPYCFFTKGGDFLLCCNNVTCGVEVSRVAREKLLDPESKLLEFNVAFLEAFVDETIEVS